MERTVKDHLDSLRGRLETLSGQFMECVGRENANSVQSEIRVVELAIAHYEAALKEASCSDCFEADWLSGFSRLCEIASVKRFSATDGLFA